MYTRNYIHSQDGINKTKYTHTHSQRTVSFFPNLCAHIKQTQKYQSLHVLRSLNKTTISE